MTIAAQFDTGEQWHLATSTGWGDFCRWADGISGSDEIQRLTEYGWSQDLPALASQISGGMKTSPPIPTVLSTVQNLVGILNNRGAAEVLVVSDGLGK